MHDRWGPGGRPTELNILRTLGLGDVVTLPDGTCLTVRSVERQLREPVGSMTGFLLGGEIGPKAALLSLPGPDAHRVSIYRPVEDVPASATDVREACWGVTSYWAPHLPGLSGALGELIYRVFHVRGQIEPLVIMWRGAERVVFVLSGTVSGQELDVLRMQIDAQVTERDVTRHSAYVTDPAYIPVPEPARAPRRSLIGA